MNTPKINRLIQAALLSLTCVLPTTLVADQATAFSGEIDQIVEQRMAVTLSSGETLWFTTLESLSDLKPGQTVSGVYEPMADTLLARDLVVESATE